MVGVVGIDITERKQSEVALQAAKEMAETAKSNEYGKGPNCRPPLS